jgi:Na+/H+-translocating membrane pyrophosphatase
MCVLGITTLHSTLYLAFANDFVPGSREGITAADIPFLCVGYGFGASFVALFMQLGGGVFTKVLCMTACCLEAALSSCLVPWL